ncbi:MAG TPA: M20/M25/M40 family metallo-hydrolase [Methylomirabilota bacterium]|nr:M20/M25/M40 family metallo-hydrolase [Methylomirabilota bacterium]
MTTPQADWGGLEHAIRARRRPIVEGLAEFLRLDTVSQHAEQVRVGGEWLARAMRARGLEARVLETGGNPAVYGALPVPGARRAVLIYCHYDVKPAPAAGWLQPTPFEPVLRRGPAEEGAPILGLGEVPDDQLPDHRLYARGSSDDKGPIWAHLTAVELMRARGIAPRVAVKFIFDGEEEMGSTNFGPFTESHRDLLAADLVLVMDGPKDASGRPTVAFGARGILSLELTLEAARRDVHSGNFNVPNPAWRLVGLLASMAAPDGTPLIEGLEDGVVPPTTAERELLRGIPLDRAGIEKELGVALPTEYLERLMFRSTLTIRGLKSGFTGQEAQTIIPHRATVAFDARLVKNQRAETVYRRILDHIRSQGFTVVESADAPIPDELRGRAIRVVERRGYDPAKTPADLPISRLVVETVERAHGGQPAVLLPTMGGSVPLWAFTDILGLPTIVVPYANANNRQHSPNEHLRLDHLFQGVLTTARLLHDLG